MHTQDSNSAESVYKNIPVNIAYLQTKPVMCFILPKLIHQYPDIQSSWHGFPKLCKNNVISTFQVIMQHF